MSLSDSSCVTRGRGMVSPLLNWNPVYAHELRGKTGVKKGSPKKAVIIVAVETQEGNQCSPRHRRTEITSLDPGEGTSGLALQGSDSEYSDQEQE